MQIENKNEVFLECKDHSVSGESFQLYWDKQYDMLITSPVPELENLSKYYESEDYISHTDGKRSGFEKVYQVVKKYALRRKVKLVSSFSKTAGSLLDIGAGTGDFLAEAKKSDWNISGTEPNELARSLAAKKGITLGTSTKRLKDDSFDVITMWHVLEHVPNLKEQLVELRRLIKKDGYVFIAVPNFKSFDAAYYKSHWAAYDVPRHLWHFSEASIRTLFLEVSMKLEKVIPMKFDSFYVSLLSEKYKTGKMNYLRAFWIGILSNWKGNRSKQYSSHIYVLKNV